MQLETRHLRSLVAVAEERSIHRAAARLGLPQPALSKQVRRIENSLRVDVFVRSPSGVEVTERGSVVVQLAREVLREIDGVAEDARLLASRTDVANRRTIRFASMATTLRSALTEVERQLGDVSFQQSVLAPPADLEGLREGAFDVIYTVDNEYAPIEVRPPLRFATVVVEPVYLAVGPAHRLAGTTEPVRLADLAGERWVTWPVGSVFRQLVDGACARAGFVPQIDCETRDLWALVQLVSEGFVSVASPATVLPPNVPVALQDGPSTRILLAWNEERVDAVTVDALLAMARDWYYTVARERNPSYWQAILARPADFPGHEVVRRPA